jgi:capsular polysaccharide biosynthesis protein
MTANPSEVTRSRWLLPITVGVVVWFLVFGVAVAVALFSTEVYASTARVKVEREHVDRPGEWERGSSKSAPVFISTECEIIGSEAILGEVVEDLKLNVEWARKFLEDGRLKRSETVTLLKKCLDVKQLRNTSLIEIRFFSESPDEAAKIANAIAGVYRAHSLRARDQPGRVVVEIVDTAAPQFRPVRPNKPFIFAMGILSAFFMGAVAGTLVFVLRRFFGGSKNDTKDSATQGLQAELDRRTILAVSIGAVVGAVTNSLFGGLLFGPVVGAIIGVAVGVSVAAAAKPRPLPPPLPQVNDPEPKRLNLERW